MHTISVHCIYSLASSAAVSIPFQSQNLLQDARCTSSAYIQGALLRQRTQRIIGEEEGNLPEQV